VPCWLRVHAVRVAPSVCEQPPTTCVNRRKWFWQTVTNLCSVQEIKLLLQLQIPNMECLIINKTNGCRPFEGRMEKDITFVNYSYKKDTLPLTRTPVTNKVLASPCGDLSPCVAINKFALTKPIATMAPSSQFSSHIKT